MTLFPDTEALKNSSFLGAVEIFFFLEHEGCLKKILWIALQILMGSCSFLRFLLNFHLPNEIRCSQSKLKSREMIKCQLMTSYMFDPNNFHST